MSLINEALKKAQRMRHQDPTGAPPPPTDAAASQSIPPVTSLPLRRGRTPASQTLLLFAGVPLLVLLSVGVTWWLLRPASSDQAPAIASVDASAPAPAAQPATSPAPSPAPTVEVKAPAASEPVISVASSPTSPVPQTESTPTVGLPASPPSPPVAEPAPAPALALSDPAQASKPDARVHAFLDTLRVTGIRSSETDPRVSMNGRVFRLNDIVDRNLELRIIAIAPEGLTFVGPNGVVYQTQF
jgi:hypothetical protein